jgi:hypothetical protein
VGYDFIGVKICMKRYVLEVGTQRHDGGRWIKVGDIDRHCGFFVVILTSLFLQYQRTK